jgi:heptosyltransferase-1
MMMDAPRILVVRLGAMGDVLHALPAVEALQRALPKAQISWLIDPKWSVLLEGNRAISETMTMNRRESGSALAAWRQVRRSRFDIAIDFQGLMKSALFVFASRAPVRLGFDFSEVRERPAALFYNQRIATHGAHVIEKNRELAAAITPLGELRPPQLPDGALEGRLPEGAFVLASPLAGWRSKQWPLKKYGELAARLRRELGIRLVVNGAPASREELARSGADVHVSGIPGLIHATRRATAVLGLDSGPMHLAAALGKPGVALFGPTNPERNGPYYDTFSVIRSAGAVTSYRRRDEHDPGLAAISAGEVFEAIRERLPENIA